MVSVGPDMSAKVDELAVEDILAKLKEIREEIAAREYPPVSHDKSCEPVRMSRIEGAIIRSPSWKRNC